MFWSLLPSVCKERCVHCLKAEENYSKVAYSFAKDRLQQHETVQRRVFFVKQHLDKENQPSMYKVFTGVMGYTTIPWLTVSVEHEFLG